VVGKGGEEALPVTWEDNYITLLPGETRTLTARYNVRELGGGSPSVLVTGWNIHRTTAR
jgi:exo-1,4-beta-D-glucosaminidase